MSKIYEERDKEYEQLSAQYQQREDALEKITKTLESQKQRQDAKEKNLTELEEKLSKRPVVQLCSELALKSASKKNNNSQFRL